MCSFSLILVILLLFESSQQYPQQESHVQQCRRMIKSLTTTECANRNKRDLLSQLDDITGDYFEAKRQPDVPAPAQEDISLPLEIDRFDLTPVEIAEIMNDFGRDVRESDHNYVMSCCLSKNPTLCNKFIYC